MKLTILTIVILLIYSNSYAQVNIKKSNISSSGNIVYSGTVKVISSVGEIAINENTQGTIHVSEGFINPDLLQITSVKSFNQLTGISIYPNPAIDYVNISLPETNNYEISIYNIQTKKIAEYNTGQTSNYKINLKKLTEGEYILIIKNNKLKQYKVFKLIKTL